MNFLLEATGNPFFDLAQTGGLIGVLCVGVWLFWREIKEQNKKIDDIRKLYDEKFDKMFERLVDLEKQNIAVHERNAAAIDGLTEVIETLKFNNEKK